MRLPHVFSDRGFRVAALAAAAISVVYILLNLFTVGGDTFIYHFNNNAANPMAILLTILAALLWRQMRAGSQSRRLWGGLCVGWALWTVAEILWAVLALAGDELPYPSWADFFWLAGYLPMIAGIHARLRTSPLRGSRMQRGIVAVIFLLWFVFSLAGTLMPALQEYDPDLWVQTLLNVLYPVFDLVLLLLVLGLYLTYGAGSYGFAWRLLSLGFIFNALSNTLFLYADWRALYYPDLQATPLSTLAIDVPYNLSYMIWVLATLALHVLLRRHRPTVVEVLPRLVSNTHILLATRDDNTLITASANGDRLFAVEDVVDRPLYEVLGVTEEQTDALRGLLEVQRELIDVPVSVLNRAGAQQEGRLCALAVSYEKGGYSGAEILIRTRLGDEGFDAELTSYERSLARRLLVHSSETSEVRRLLLDYYLTYLRSLYNLAYLEGGAVMAQVLLDDLQAVADARGWSLSCGPEVIVDGAAASLQELRAALPVLLETGRQTTALMVDGAAVTAAIEAAQARFSVAVHANVAQYAEGIELLI